MNHPFDGRAGALATTPRLISVLASADGLFLPTALFLEDLRAASSGRPSYENARRGRIFDPG